MKTEKLIEQLRKEGYKIIEPKRLLKIPELNIEVMPIQEWTNPYNEIQIPEGFRLIRLSEILYIWETEKYRKIFFADYLKNPVWTWIWCEQLFSDQKRKRSRGFYLDGYSDVYSDCGCLAFSVDCGRVVFVREVLK